MNVEIAVLEIKRHLQAFALNRGEQRRVDIEIDGVAKLVTFTRGCGFHASRKINCVVTSGSAFAETPKQISEGLVAQKIQAFFGDFETNVTRQRIRNFARSRHPILSLTTLRLFFVQRQITFFDEA